MGITTYLVTQQKHRHAYTLLKIPQKLNTEQGPEIQIPSLRGFCTYIYTCGIHQYLDALTCTCLSPSLKSNFLPLIFSR